MSLGPLLRKEVTWVRHNLGALFVVLLLLPATFGLATGAFERVVPEDVPVAVVPASEDVTEDEVTALRAVTAVFASPTAYDTVPAARRALHREAVYGVVVVPPGLFDEGATADVRFLVEGEIVPYNQPSRAIANVLGARLDSQLAADVSVTREVTGREATLSEYLLSAGVVILLATYAFTYVPYNVASERRVFRRLRVESSLGAVVASKFCLFGVLVSVPLVALQGAANVLGHDLNVLAPAALGTLLLTFGYLTAISLGVMFLTGFRAVGRFLNVAVLFGTLLLGNPVYPAGFFSPLRREIARFVPVHYSTLTTRGVALKGRSVGLYGDYLLVLGATTLVALAWLALSMAVYRRRA